MLYQTKNSHGGDIYAEELLLDYSANTNPFGTPRTVLDAAAASLDGLSAYPDPYCRGLVNALSAYEQVPRDRILCSGGASELIYAFCRALKPKTALVPVPSFSEYEKALGLCGCAPSHFLLKQENDFAVTEELLTVLLKEKPQVLFLCTPNNPTGVLLEPALLQKLLQLCLQTGTFVLLDECFLDMTAEGISAAAVADRFPNLVILKAFTKNFGMAGLRLGYCISYNAGLLKALAEECQPWNVSTPAQAAGIAACSAQDFLQKTRGLIEEERPKMAKALQSMGFYVCPSKANFLLFQGPAGLDEALRKEKIAIRSCSNFAGLKEGWYRIAVRLPAQNKQLMAAIARAAGKESPWQKTS